MKSVLQDWVMELPLRFQGTLLSDKVSGQAKDLYFAVHNMHLNPELPSEQWDRLTEDRIATNTVVS